MFDDARRSSAEEAPRTAGLLASSFPLWTPGLWALCRKLSFLSVQIEPMAPQADLFFDVLQSEPSKMNQ
jgi:hypothetical protein